MAAADQKSVSVDELKSAFKEGATPNEEDYHTLIDLAAVGSKALGGDNNTPPRLSPGTGLQMVADKLAVKVNQDAGVTLDGDGVAVKGDGKTITVTADGVGIKVKANGGLESNTDGLHVKAGPGLKTDQSGLEIKVAEKGGLKADKDGLAVHIGAGLDIDVNGALTVKAKSGEGNYITSTTAGLAITKEGIGKIKEALESATLDALEKAVSGTNKGFKTYSNKTGKEDVEQKIAGKLNEAFTEGWQLKRPRDALSQALKDVSTQSLDSSSIGPSSVSGMTGLYSLDGTEYTPEQILAFKVSSSGTVERTKWDATHEGIYAIVGKVNEKGEPSTSGSQYTKVALMVTVENKNRAVIGHWDLKRLGEDTSGWSTAMGQDSVAELNLRKLIVDAEKIKKDQELATLKSAYEDDLDKCRSEAQRKLINAALFPGEATSNGKTYPLTVSKVNNAKITALALNIYEDQPIELHVVSSGNEDKRNYTEFTLRFPLKIKVCGLPDSAVSADGMWQSEPGDNYGFTCHCDRHYSYGTRAGNEWTQVWFANIETFYDPGRRAITIRCHKEDVWFGDPWHDKREVLYDEPKFEFGVGARILVKVKILDVSVWLNIFSQKE